MKKIALLTVSLIIGSLGGLQAHQCPCLKPTKEQKQEKREHHKKADDKIKEMKEQQKLRDKCYTKFIKTEPCPKIAFYDKVKRDSNGDRV